MIISVHIGSHHTHNDTVIRSLAKNSVKLKEHGIIVPPRNRYKLVLPELLKRMQDSRATPETEEMFIEELADFEDCDRLVLSFDNLLCYRAAIFQRNQLYSKASSRLKALRNVFPDSTLEFVLGVRNPATLIPTACAKPDEYGKFIGKTNLDEVRWSDVINSIRATLPEVPVTVFAYEDTPIIWEQVLREFSGLDASIPMDGGLDVLLPIITRDGMRQLRTYLHTHQPKSQAQYHEIVATYLERFVNIEAIEQEINLPGWTDDLVQRLTERYEDDLFDIERIPGVKFIQP